MLDEQPVSILFVALHVLEVSAALKGGHGRAAVVHVGEIDEAQAPIRQY